MKLSINADTRYTETEIIVNCNHLSDEIDKILASIRMLDMKIMGHKDGRQCILEIADIMYFESTDKHTFFYTANDTYESNFKLYEMEAKLTDRGFLRASKNCLFNISHLKSIETELNSRLILTMPKDIKLIVSRQYASVIKQKLEEYIHG